jgi:hypothetical protein
MTTEREALSLIRATATRSVPNCINLPAIDRILADVAAAPAEWLDLPALHARLLPLAQAAGHEKLLLSVAIGDGLPCYEADATGGPSGFRRYVGRFDYGDTPSQFEGRLTELLQQQATYRTTQPTSHASH